MITYQQLSKRNQRRIDRAYKAFAAQQPCIVSQASPVHLHHYRSQKFNQFGFPVGMGLKPPDILILPLAPTLHNQGKASIHALGNERFEAMHGVNLDQCLGQLHDLFWQRIRAVSALKS